MRHNLRFHVPCTETAERLEPDCGNQQPLKAPKSWQGTPLRGRIGVAASKVRKAVNEARKQMFCFQPRERRYGADVRAAVEGDMARDAGSGHIEPVSVGER